MNYKRLIKSFLIATCLTLSLCLMLALFGLGGFTGVYKAVIDPNFWLFARPLTLFAFPIYIVIMTVILYIPTTNKEDAAHG
ncbi:hypothetical protein [Neptuniibacter sp. QD37_11]|uniref:hypothetical protein n=1 Tax=Neptuniibacter sp. QD37_11 TaxID=3398209 RepID=UPI0039F5F515